MSKMNVIPESMPCEERLAGLVKHEEEEPPYGGGQAGRLSKWQLFYTICFRLKKFPYTGDKASLDGCR